MTTSEQIGELAAALAKAQAEMEGAVKDAANPFFKSKYADLASVRAACVPFLSKHGLAVVQSPSISLTTEFGAGVTVETRLIHASGQWMAGTLSCAMKDASPQSVGSAITYLRRYALQSFAGVAPEDDDAEAAQGSRKPQEAAKPDVPAGFSDWLDDLSVLADEGTARLEKAWKASKAEYRQHLTVNYPEKWGGMKARAKHVDITSDVQVVR
jgi:hypothetical protein